MALCAGLNREFRYASKAPLRAPDVLPEVFGCPRELDRALEKRVSDHEVGRDRNLAAMLAAAQQTKRSPETGDLFVPIQLVAGACNQRYLQLWSGAA